MSLIPSLFTTSSKGSSNATSKKTFNTVTVDSNHKETEPAPGLQLCKLAPVATVIDMAPTQVPGAHDEPSRTQAIDNGIGQQ